VDRIQQRALLNDLSREYLRSDNKSIPLEHSRRRHVGQEWSVTFDISHYGNGVDAPNRSPRSRNSDIKINSTTTTLRSQHQMGTALAGRLPRVCTYTSLGSLDEADERRFQ
jgi:hypothetical protein